MRYQKKGAMRLTALLLAAGMALGLAPPPARAAGDNSFVSSSDLNDIFNWVNPPGFGSNMGIHGKNIYFANTTAHVETGGSYTAASNVASKRWVSLESDWEFRGTFDVTIDPDTPHIFTRGFVVLKARDTNQILFSAGKFNEHLGLRIMTGTAVAPNTATPTKKDLTAAYFNGSKSFNISYSATSHILSCTYGDNTLTYDVYKFFPADTKEITVTLAGTIAWEKGKSAPSDSKVSGTFANAAYTKYNPQFVKTEVLQTNGTPFPANSPPVNSQIVMVKSTMRNTNANAHGQAVPCTLKLLQGNQTYPTAGIVPLVQGQSIYANGAEVPANTDIVNSGIPFKMIEGDNTVTYLAQIVNPSGAAVTVGQTIADDFFQSHRYSSAEVVPALPLKPGEVDKEPEPGQPAPNPGTDYHYTRTPANANGWNSGNVDVTFYEGAFNQFNITSGGAVNATLHSGNPTKQYSGETGTGGIPLSYQAVNTSSGQLSTTKTDTVKIDTTPPVLTAGEGGALSVSDALAGVWKLERQDPVTGAWSAANTFPLTKGNGDPVQSVTPAKNGVYRAVDAAGNISAATLPVTVNDPPEIDVKNTHHPSPQGPATTVDANGLAHAVYRDAVDEIITDPPAYGGALTAAELQAVVENRYQFTSHSGALSYQLVSMTQNGADIATAGLPSSAPGSCQAVYQVTDQDGNTATLNLTYSFIEKPLPPSLSPVDPEYPPTGPSEEIGPWNTTVHHTYRDHYVELIADPPAYGGTFSAADALAFIKAHYAFAAREGDSLTETLAMSQGDADILATGLPSSTPGSCLITYTVEDEKGNTTTLELTYTFKTRPVMPPVTPIGPGPAPDGPEEPPPGKDGTLHHTYTYEITRIITDPPEFDGVLTAEKLREIIEGRYTFGPGDVSFAMTQSGADISAQGLPSSTPGSCLGSYTVTDGQGNTVTLLLTYRYIEKPRPPVPVPSNPEHPPEGPRETITGPDDPTVHHCYTDTVVELISHPPAYGGHFTIGDALGYIRDHYDFAAGSTSLTGHALSMEQEGDPAVEISSAVPGSCLITYTVTDRDGNSTTLELTYIFKERVEPPTITPIDPEYPPQGPEEQPVGPDGLIHHTYRDRIVVAITDPPQFGGALTADKLREIIETRYTFGEGVVTFAMTPDSLPSTVPGSCTGIYTATDGEGNSTTLELTYEYVERYDPPVIGPADPERPLPDPEETVDPDATVHRNYQDSLTEPVAYPPAFGGNLSAEAALNWMQSQYQIAPGTGTHLRENVALYQDGQEITPQGFATDREGSCLILYRVTDEYGNSSTLAFTYALTERQVEGGDIRPDGTGSGQNPTGSGPYTGELGGHTHRQPADCWVHWLALALTVITLAYLLVRKRQLDREEEKARENL
ncbi:hypothetical protein [Bittarella massiliensis (ex Durand et al. 2017)]|uniref:hypothetical protein n=1 Tax=Bittarella massiliensis (ex Durand et al. 2017) TaxID=1720313 RepID=UPI001AA0F35E|nr:hypothetical protein [Bittarella massiliensis (ex Durand et al. 2017)]MBO1680378.1 hypothetical protein [Bittarella massiliensis (ex Durand et al. 2017)]